MRRRKSERGLPERSLSALVLIGALLVAGLLSLAGCGSAEGAVPRQGYAAGECVLVAAPDAGMLKNLQAPRGEGVAAAALPAGFKRNLG